MSNEPRDLSGKRLRQALHLLGRNPAISEGFLDFLKRAETRLGYVGSLRNDVTSPVLDALPDDEDRYEKTLADGSRSQFLFRTKRARDFLLSEDARPSHVWEPQTTGLLLHLTSGIRSNSRSCPPWKQQ